MLEWTSTLPLWLQAALAILMVEQFRRQVLPALMKLDDSALFSDVWGPLALVLPMLFFIGRIQFTVAGAGWMAIGAPMTCSYLALGIALLARRSFHAENTRFDLRAVTMWTITGLIVLLLGAAQDLTLWMGQCAFVTLAVLLWINTPDDVLSESPTIAAASMRAGVGMTLTLLFALGQGVLSLFVPLQFQATSGAIMIASTTIAIAATARMVGGNFAVRLGGWAMTYGVLATLGVLSLLRLAPEAVRAILTQRTERLYRLAHGFDQYWIEATAAIAFGGFAIALLKLRGPLRIICGTLLLIAAAALAAWRLAGV